MKHKKLSPKHLLGGVISSKVRFPVLLPWRVSMRSSPLPFAICKGTLHSCFPAKAGLPPGRSALHPCVATCSEPGLPQQHDPLALVGVAQHGCPCRAGADMLPAGFSGLICAASCSSVSLIQLQECWIWDIGSRLGMGRGMSASSEGVYNAGDTNQKQEIELICPGFLLIEVEEPWKSVRVLAWLKTTGEASQFAL